MSNVGVLAHYEERRSRPRTFIPASVADVLVRRLAAEPISRRVIRMLRPDSVFLPAKDFRQPQPQTEGESLNLAANELPGLKVQRTPAQLSALCAARHREALETIALYAWE